MGLEELLLFPLWLLRCDYCASRKLNELKVLRPAQVIRIKVVSELQRPSPHQRSRMKTERSGRELTIEKKW
jgi:hypothetical protein